MAARRTSFPIRFVFPVGAWLSGELTLTSTNFQNKKSPIKVSLNGFTAAFDGPPLKRTELQNRQKKLQEELQKKADEARKKLEDAQKKAKE